MDPKVRNRTSDELLVRKKEFLKICDILDELKINYFLQTGILLGAIRDNDFIKWDWDIEISVFSDELLLNIDLIVNKLKNDGFKIKQINKKTNLSFGAFYDETLVSFMLGDLFNIEKILEYEILLIYVCKNFRKKGLGTKLLNKIEENNTRLKKIYLEVSKNNA